MLFRKAVIVFCLLSISFGIGYLFWNQELQYTLPTPLPDHYAPPASLSAVHLQDIEPSENKPLFIHYFNPECPCSKFNVRHVHTLIKNYGDRIQFKAIIPWGSDLKQASRMLPEGMIVLQDTEDKKLATACGVYSTPQAVVLTKDGKLYFRGNYNKARYCTLKNTNYAELALIDILSGIPPRDFGSLASIAYGCEYKSIPGLF